MTGSFLFSRWPDYLFHANSLDRLALQVTPVGILFAAHVWTVIREEEPATHGTLVQDFMNTIKYYFKS